MTKFLSFRLLCPFQCENMSYLWNNYSISLYIFTGENKKQHYLLGWVKTRKKKKKVQELCMQEKITTLQHCQHYLLGWIKKRITKKKKKPNQINQTKKPKNCVCERKQQHCNTALELPLYHQITAERNQPTQKFRSPLSRM